MDISRLVDKLSEEQQKNALMVAQEAVKQGVNPNLAVAIAYQESKLLTNVRRGNDGEYGIMQVLPSTGKEMGFDEKALQDPAKNIAAGIQYLKRGLEETGGDTKLTAAFYNGGPGAIVALREGKSPDPRVLNYVRSLSGLGVFAEPEKQEPQAAAGQQEDMIPQPVEPTAPAAPQTDTSGASSGERLLMGGLGAGAGAVATGIQGVSDARTNTATNRAFMEETARERARMAAQTAPAAPGGAPAAPAGAPGAGRSPIPSGGPDGGRMARGQTGTMPYNYAKAAGLTDIEAGRALDMTKQSGGVHDLTTQRREGMQRIQQLFPGERYVENPRFGGLLTPDQGAGGGPRQSFAVQGPVRDVPPGTLMGPAAPPPEGALRQLPPRVPISTAPIAPTTSGLEKVSDIFKGMMRPVATAASTVSKYALPPVAGLSAGLDLAEVAHEYGKPADQKDLAKMALRGASAFGGGLSMIPTLPTRAVGIPLSLGASAIQAYREDPEMISRFKRRIFNPESAPQEPFSDPMTGWSP